MVNHLGSIGAMKRRPSLLCGGLVVLAGSLAACGSSRSTPPPPPGPRDMCRSSGSHRTPRSHADATVNTTGKVVRLHGGIYALVPSGRTRISLDPHQHRGPLGRPQRARRHLHGQLRAGLRDPRRAHPGRMTRGAGRSHRGDRHAGATSAPSRLSLRACDVRSTTASHCRARSRCSSARTSPLAARACLEHSPTRARAAHLGLARPAGDAGVAARARGARRLLGQLVHGLQGRGRCRGAFRGLGRGRGTHRRDRLQRPADRQRARSSLAIADRRCRCSWTARGTSAPAYGVAWRCRRRWCSMHAG